MLSPMFRCVTVWRYGCIQVETKTLENFILEVLLAMKIICLALVFLLFNVTQGYKPGILNVAFLLKRNSCDDARDRWS